MQITAKLKHLRIASRKVRLVADLIRGLTVIQAEQQLNFLVKRSVKPIGKLLKSAVANAENNAKLVKDNLYISKISVDEGATLKRWRARAMGRAAEIMKRTSHITLVLDEIKPGVKKENIKAKEKKIIQESKNIKNKNKKLERELIQKTYKDSGVSRAKKMFRRKSI